MAPSLEAYDALYDIARPKVQVPSCRSGTRQDHYHDDSVKVEGSPKVCFWRMVIVHVKFVVLTIIMPEEVYTCEYVMRYLLSVSGIVKLLLNPIFLYDITLSTLNPPNLSLGLF